jgi:protease IV
MAKEEKKRSPLVIAGLIVGGLFLFIIVFFILIFIFALAAAFSSTPTESRGNVAHIKIEGIITTAAQTNIFAQETGASSDRIVAHINRAKEDRSIKGVIFEINSPGGSGVASDEIAKAIRELDKPTVTYVREVGTSGAYWIASSTDHIYANRLSTIGSIGVIASYLEFSGLLERYNISYQRFVAGEQKDFGSPFREPTPAETERFQAQLNEIHEIFIAEVAAGRNLEPEYIRSIADGSFVTGNAALELGLIDGFGGYNEAVEHMENVLGTKVSVVRYRQPTGFFQALSGYINKQLYLVGKGIGSGLLPEQRTIIYT